MGVSFFFPGEGKIFQEGAKTYYLPHKHQKTYYFPEKKAEKHTILASQRRKGPLLPSPADAHVLGTNLLFWTNILIEFVRHQLPRKEVYGLIHP